MVRESKLWYDYTILVPSGNADFDSCRQKDFTSWEKKKMLFVVPSLCHPTDLFISLVLALEFLFTFL